MKNNRFLRKAFIVTMAIVMVFAMSATAFAANINYTVEFTHDGNNNGMYHPWGPTESKSISDTIPLSQKTYFIKDGVDYSTNSNVNPLGTGTSVIDAIIKALNDKGKTFTCGLDLNPKYGTPGAYIKQVEGFVSWNQYVEYQENGQWYGRSYGQGWQCYITPSGGTEAGATAYLSTLPLNAGDHLRFDFRYYDYSWPIDGPTQ